jgi:hypothetical protein
VKSRAQVNYIDDVIYIGINGWINWPIFLLVCVLQTVVCDN